VLWSPHTQLHYPFQNTATDYSGNARNGTVNGSGAYATKPNGGRCLYFDGTGDSVSTPSFGLSGTVVVFAAWVRCKLLASDIQGILSDNANSATVGFLWVRRPANANDLTWFYANGSAITPAGSPNFFADPFNDTWLHAVVVCDYSNKNCYFFRNATLVSTVALTGTPEFPTTARVKYLGIFDSANYPLSDGYLADVYLGTLLTMPAAAQMLANAKRLMLGFNPIW